MTLTLSIIQRTYDLTIEANGITLQTTLVSSSHRHGAADISDASPLGRSLLVVPDAAAARALLGAGGGAGLADGDHGGVIVSGGGTVLALDYVEINATVQPDWTRITGKPSTLSGYGITDALTSTAAAQAFQPLSAVLTATTAAYTSAEKTKLAAIAAGATANASDAQLRDRATHTGTQLASTVADFAAAADARVAAGITGKADAGHGHAFADLADKPTTLAGYGITDALHSAVAPSSTQWVHLGDGRGPTSQRAEVSNILRMRPYVADHTGDLTAVAIVVTIAVAGSQAKVAFYSSDALGRPANLLAETVSMDCSTTGAKTAAVSLSQTKGVQYWVAVRVSANQALSTDTNSPRIDGLSLPVNGAPSTVGRFVTYADPAPATWAWSPSEIVINRDPWFVLGQYA